MSKRAEERRQARKQQKVENKMYRYDEVQKIAITAEQEARVAHAVGFARVLSLRGFTKEQICEIMRESLIHVKHIITKGLTIDEVKEASDKLGVEVRKSDIGFIVRIGDEANGDKSKEATRD